MVQHCILSVTIPQFKMAAPKWWVYASHWKWNGISKHIFSSVFFEHYSLCISLCIHSLHSSLWNAYKKQLWKYYYHKNTHLVQQWFLVAILELRVSVKSESGVVIIMETSVLMNTSKQGNCYRFPLKLYCCLIYGLSYVYYNVLQPPIWFVNFRLRLHLITQ